MSLLLRLSVVLSSPFAFGATIDDADLSTSFFDSGRGRFDEMGALHTKAFNDLAAMYSSERPACKEDMINDVHDVVASLVCDGNENNDDDGKKDSTTTTTTTTCREFFASKNRGDGTTTTTSSYRYDAKESFPYDFDARLAELLDETYSAVWSLAYQDENKVGRDDTMEDDVRKVLERLEAVRSGIVEHGNNGPKEQNEVVSNPLHLNATLAAISVAVESTKLWTAVYSDKQHPLHGLHHSSYYDAGHRKLGRRRTEEDGLLGHHYYYYGGGGWWGGGGGGGDDSNNNLWEVLADRFNLIDIIQADIDGAVFGVLEETDENPVVAINPALLFTAAFAGAVVRSAIWATTPPTPAPSMAPTVSPSPTVSTVPSASPTVSSAPTVSASPSTSPSVSTAPTVSPSASPTVSTAPTVSASPSASPT